MQSLHHHESIQKHDVLLSRLKRWILKSKYIIYNYYENDIITISYSAKSYTAVVHDKSDEERKRIHDIIKDNMLFRGLDKKQSDILLDAMFPKEYEEGEVIITQGGDGDNFYVLDTGICEVYKDDALVQTCTEAMSFGELALMYNAPRAATVKVKEKAKVWALDRQSFKVRLTIYIYFYLDILYDM